MSLRRLLPLLCSLALLPLHGAPLERIPRKVPPAGIPVPEKVRGELEDSAAILGRQIEELRRSATDKPDMLALLPDVEIFHKAVDWALRYNEIFEPKQLETAKKLLLTGTERLDSLKGGSSPWTTQTGLQVRGYRSRIDGSIQPYGLVIPENWKPDPQHGTRLDFWMHGRGEKLSELAFLEDRMRNKGEFSPDGTIVLHLYGRFCNANKFAGETDLFEALESVRSRYSIDLNKLTVRGFSMGGASTWQFGTHHAGLWAGVAPGAGFAETAEFFGSFAPGKTPPPWWEQVLWRWYDSTLYAANLSNTEVVAYSGEIDKQKQAADIMARYMEQEGLTLLHLIGPKMPHKYDPETKPKIDDFLARAVGKDRSLDPEKVHLTTYTLIYNRMNWVSIDGMQKEWERADVDARLNGPALEVTTRNVSALRLRTPIGAELPREVVLDGQKLKFDPAAGGQYFWEGGEWKSGAHPSEELRKMPGLCGPIDHAFMSAFTMVRPTGAPMNETVGAWAKFEMEHALDFWRAVYRGDAPVKNDNELTDDDIKNSNLVLWGDPASNGVLAKIADKLPIRWTSGGIEAAGQTYETANFAPILIFPNPLNPNKYVVVNSGVTFREQALANNSDQTPKLPDWAIVDLRTPPSAQAPGLVVDAGFFDEQWRLPAPAK